MLPATVSEVTHQALRSVAPCETMHSSRIILWIRPPRWCGASHGTSHTFHYEFHVCDIAPHRRGLPAVAFEEFENLFAFQRIRRLHVTDGLHGVSASSEHLAEC